MAKKITNLISIKILIGTIFFVLVFLYLIYSILKIKEAKKINLLTTKVQLSYLKKLLNEPVFINYLKNSSQKEYIFVNSNFYTQVITDKNDKVLAFFVTSRNKNFNPEIKKQAFNFVLGKSSLKDINNNSSPEKCFGYLGNTAKSYYYEQYYFGRQGKYQTYVFGYNDAGFNLKDKNNLDFLIGIKEKENICAKVNNNNRRDIIINTYGIISDEAKKIDFEYGVDKNLVSLLDIDQDKTLYDENKKQ